MFIGISYRGPDQQDRYGKNQRFADYPTETKALTAKPGINFPDQKSAYDAPLGRKIFAESRHNTNRLLGRGVLADIRNKQPSQSVNEHAGGDNGDKRDDPFREKRVIREVRLGNCLEI